MQSAVRGLPNALFHLQFSTYFHQDIQQQRMSGPKIDQKYTPKTTKMESWRGQKTVEAVIRSAVCNNSRLAENLVSIFGLIRNAKKSPKTHRELHKKKHSHRIEAGPQKEPNLALKSVTKSVPKRENVCTLIIFEIRKTSLTKCLFFKLENLQKSMLKQ